MRKLSERLALEALKTAVGDKVMPGVTLEQLVERVDNGFKRMDDRFDINDTAHDGIIERQDKTNGNVKNLQIWYYTLVGAAGVLGSGLTLFAILHDHIHVTF